jgi:2-methylcitrate dehydratase PrpD
MTLLQEFGVFIETSQKLTFTDDVMHHARRALLDWQGSLIAGSDSLVAQKLHSSYKEELGFGKCAVAGTTQTAFTRAAAFMNGSISHIAEFDDIYRDGAYHPAAPTISGVFALAQSRDASLNDLLRAIIIGYEVSTRISRVIQPSHYQFFHTTGTAGVFGSAAACAFLLKLDATQACAALATAGTFASGLQQAFRSDSMTKPMHAGHAAEVGLHAALASEEGMSGTPDLLEGAAGFGAALSKNPRWEELFDQIGQSWSITQMTFKNHGCCGHNFPGIDAVSNLLQQYPIVPDQIKKIRVGAYQATNDVCCYVHPASAFEAKFSLTYTVAARIVLGRVREKAFLEQSLQDSRIYALENKIELFEDVECTSHFPVRRSAKVSIEMQDGTIYSHYQKTRHGDPDEPLTDEELLDKFIELSEPRIGINKAEQLATLILESNTENLKDLATLW